MKKLVPTELPKSATATFKIIKEIIAKGWMDMPVGKSYGGTGAPGRFLEHLCEIQENNRDSPDLNDWEVKFHSGTAPITLFHKSPEPRGIMGTVVHLHGWPAKNQTSFRHTVWGTSDRGFYVVNESDRVVIRNSNLDSVVPYWTHNVLLTNCAAKIRRLIVIDGEYKKAQRKIRYTGATAYWGLRLTGFAPAIADGTIAIDFDARTTQGHGSVLRDHGTKFRIKEEDLSKIYDHKRKIT